MQRTGNQKDEFVNELNNRLGINKFPINSPTIDIPKELEESDPIEILNRLTRTASEIYYLSENILKQNETVSSFTADAEKLIAENLRTVQKIRDVNASHVESLSNHSASFFNIFRKEKIDLSDRSLEKLDQMKEFTKNIVEIHDIKVPKIIRFFEKTQYWILGTSLFLVLLVVFMTNMSYNWYKTSIKTKEEVRASVLAEIVTSKQKIYSVDYVSELQENTTIMQSWMKKNKNSNEVEKFIQFKDGYVANKNEKVFK